MKHTPRELIEQCIYRWKLSANEFEEGELAHWIESAETILEEFEKEEREI